MKFFVKKTRFLELECSEGETRRTNTLTANGVLVESYSPNEILC